MKKVKRVFSLLSLLCVILYCAGCAKTVIPEEVLQLPEYSTVRTAYNLWYITPEKKEKPSVIDELNTQKGQLLPYGTEIEFLKSDTDGIVFKRKSDGAKFVMKYNKGKNLIPIEELIRLSFTTKPLEVLNAGIRSLDQEKLKRGLVEKGMRRSEVLLGFGPPPPLRTPSQVVDTWTYWVDFGITKKVVFFHDRVLEIIQLD